MAQTTKEATRLVYVEGIDLQNALSMSKNYPNIIFLTDDNINSSDLSIQQKTIDESELSKEIERSSGTGVVDDNWDIGLNIVRNGHKYIVVRGINSFHNSFTADGTKYTLRIDQHGLLYLDTNVMKERFIYIGRSAVNENGEFQFDVQAIIDACINDRTLNCIKHKEILIQNRTGRDETITDYLYLVILQDNENLGTDFGYMWIFSSLDILRDATHYRKDKYNGTLLGPLANMNYKLWYKDNDGVLHVWNQSIQGESEPYINGTYKDAIDVANNEIEDTKEHVFTYNETNYMSTLGKIFDPFKFENVNKIDLFVLLPVTYEDSIIITNTLSSNRYEDADVLTDENKDQFVNPIDDVDDIEMQNNHLLDVFELDLEKARKNPIKIRYNSAEYNVYKFDKDIDVKSLGFYAK